MGENITRQQHLIITFSVMLAAFIQTLDATIVNVALTYIQGSLSATQEQMAWVLTSYILATAIMIPFTGWLSGVVGRKVVLLASVIGFIVASILCGMAESLPAMVIFRFLQGAFGAALVPLSQSILLSINSKANYAKAMAIWGIGVTMGPILGPVLGGWLTQNYDWRWIFYINVPIGFLAFAGLYFALPETKKRKNQFDFLGFFTLSLGVGVLQILLDRGELKDWFGSTEIIAETIIMGIAFYLFFVHTWTFKTSKSRRPFINPALFKDTNFTIASILMFILGVVLFATLALLPPMLQNQLNYPVLTAGLATAPRSVGTLLSMFIVGRLSSRFDNRWLIGIGLLMIIVSLWQMTQYSLQTDMWGIVSAGLVQGFGLGFTYITLTAVAFSKLPDELHDEGTSFFNLMRNLGSSIGISIVEAFLIQKAQIVNAVLGENIIPYNMLANMAYAANHINVNTEIGLIKLGHMVTNQAVMIAYIEDYQLIMIMTLAILPLLFFLHKATKTSTDERGIDL